MSNLQKTENLAGAGKKEGLRVSFDLRVKLEVPWIRKSPPMAGCWPIGSWMRPWFDRSALELLHDWRTGENNQRSMVALLR